jgi:long-chain acyl-CoA synthetase
MVSDQREQVSAPVAALRRQAGSEPDRVAVIAGGETWTAGRLDEQSARLAAGLAQQGVTAGDRVALHFHNQPEAVLAYLACLRLGAVAMPLNTRLTTPELRDLTERTQPLVYLGEPELYPRFAPVPPDLVPGPARFLAGTGRWDDLLDPAAEAVPDAEPDPGSPAVLLSTSGTTGQSKIVVWSHRTLAALALSAAGRGIGPGEVFPLITPLMHGAGVYYLLNALPQGATAVLVRQFDPAATLDAMERHRATNVFGLPFMCAELVREQRARPRDVGSLRTATVAGDVCPAEVEAGFQAAFGVPLPSYWAAAEDVGATVAAPDPGPFMQVIPEASYRIAGPGDEPVPSGEPGELWISSPTTSPGYWSGLGRLTPLPDGGFRSGDLVREVQPGLLQYLGRAKDLIVRGGSNISPVEVEDTLRAHPAVADAGVAGYPDATLGQRVGALVVLAPGADVSAADLRAWAGQRLAAYKVPEQIRFVAAIPRNALTKVDRLAVTSGLYDPA